MAGVAPFVIGARLAGLALDPGSARSRAETQRMVAEKMAAAGEAAMAAGFQMALDGMRMWGMMAAGRTPDVADAADRIAGRAARPYAKRVRANAKRLSRKTR